MMYLIGLTAELVLDGSPNRASIIHRFGSRCGGGGRERGATVKRPFARRHQSGESIDYEGRITKQGDFNVREALCEAAASMLLRAKSWSALRAWGLKIAKRSSMMCAIVAVARKLASIIHRMWIDNTELKYGMGAKVTPHMRMKRATLLKPATS